MSGIVLVSRFFIVCGVFYAFNPLQMGFFESFFGDESLLKSCARQIGAAEYCFKQIPPYKLASVRFASEKSAMVHLAKAKSTRTSLESEKIGVGKIRSSVFYFPFSYDGADMKPGCRLLLMNTDYY